MSGGGGLNLGWCAGGDSRCQPIFSENYRALRLSGMVLDTINQVGELLKLPESFSENFAGSGNGLSHVELSSILGVFVQWADMTEAFCRGKEYITGESQLDAFWQSIIAGRHTAFLSNLASTIGDDFDWTTDSSREAIREDFLTFWNGCTGLRWAKRHSPTQLGSHLVDIAWAWDVAGGLFKSKQKGRLWYTLSPIAINRKLVRTSRGYISLVPGLTMPGDTIAILEGGDTPFVIRRRDADWELIGECYVHGVMSGEAYRAEDCCAFRFV